MSRVTMVLCFSTSLVALGVAGFALLESGAGGMESRETRVEDLNELQTLLTSLQKKVSEHEASHAALKRRTFKQRAAGTDTRTQNADLPAPGQAGGLQEQVVALTERLASLEDEETIARLAQSGGKQVAEKEIRNALEQVGDPEADPEARLEALKRLRIAGKDNGAMMESLMGENEMLPRDLYLPMLDLAQDTTLDAAFRADVVRNFQGTRIEELRQPMLDLVASGDLPEVRKEALTTLYWHLDDATVRGTIKQVSQQDPHEAVQAAAKRVLPRVENREKEAARSEDAAGAGEER